jgi:hypothetical protein
MFANQIDSLPNINYCGQLMRITGVKKDVYLGDKLLKWNEKEKSSWSILNIENPMITEYNSVNTAGLANAYDLDEDKVNSL